jgi:short-subunit dehydrogenase
MKKVIITGATSGIGYELAIQMAKKGYKVGLIGRRTERLEQLADEIRENAYYRTCDVTDYETANVMYQGLIDEMGGMDIMILNAGVGIDTLLPKWESDHKTIEVNVTAFVHGAHFAFNYFRSQKSGQIVGMSSIASHLASGRAAAYTASKHFISNYMTGLRQKVNKLELDVVISDIRPGYVVSEMTENNKSMFWVAGTDKAVSQMVTAIEKKKKRAYITKRWTLIAWVAALTPQFVWDRLKF